MSSEYINSVEKAYSSTLLFDKRFSDLELLFDSSAAAFLIAFFVITGTFKSVAVGLARLALHGMIYNVNH